MKCKQYLCALLAVLLLVSVMPFAAFAEGEDPTPEPETPAYRTITVPLLEGEENAEENWRRLDAATYGYEPYIAPGYAISETDPEAPLPDDPTDPEPDPIPDTDLPLLIVIETPGTYPRTYYVGKSSSPAAIRLHSNTTIDLNGSTLIRANQMGNFFQNCDENGDREGTGYNLSENITIKNGTVDGTNAANDSSNLFNFGHAANIRVEHVALSNGTGAHLIEFTGCRDCVVSGCTFTGVSTAASYTDASEAVQFDICDFDSGGKDWNGVYCSNSTTGDDTPCLNMRVEDCSFVNFPSAVGNHKGIHEVQTKNITVTGCTIKTDVPSSCPAIWAYNFSDCLFTGNTISGAYAMGIQISGGNNVCVQTNTIKIPGPGVYVTHAPYSYVKHSGGKMVTEYAANAQIIQNTIANSRKITNENDKKGAICVYSSAHAKAITDNTVSASWEKGVTVTSGGKVSLISGNYLKASNATAMHVSGGTVGKILNNTIIAKPNALQVGSGSKVTEISGNIVTSTAGNAIHITASTVGTLKGNTINKCPHDSIAVISGSKVTEISANNIAGSGENGVRITSATVGGVLSNKITSTKKTAVYISNKAKVTNVKANYLKTASGSGIYVTASTVTNIIGNTCINCKQSGIRATSNGKVGTVFANAVHGAKDYGIYLTNASATVKIGNNALRVNSRSGVKNSGKTKKANKAGWQKIGSNHYYFDAKGNTKVAFQKIKKSGKTYTYYFNKYGIMLKGWQKIKNTNGKTYTYYFQSNGIMQTGTAVIDGKTYYFGSNGICKNP